MFLLFVCDFVLGSRGERSFFGELEGRWEGGDVDNL